MKIKFDPPTLDAKQIVAKKDFALLMKRVNEIPTRPFYKSGWFITTAFTLGITLSVLLVLENAPEKNISKNIKETKSEKTIIYKEDSPCVNPPSKQLEIPFKRFTIDPTVAQQISLENATLSIPKLAFKRSDNTIIEDSIVLLFRVFNDPIDFIISGIPMEYDSAGTVYTFESAGMFELKGQTLAHQAVTISKPLNITFATENVNGFNFYSLDTTTHNWNYISSNNIKTKNIEIEVPKEDEPINNNQLKKELTIANHKWKQAERNLTTHKKTKPTPPSPVTNIDKTFVLDIDKYEFPELSFFYKVKFEPVDVNSVEASVYTTDWESKRIRQYKKGENYQLILTHKQQIVIVIVKAVYDGEDLETMTNSYLKKLERYELILKEKQEIANKREQILADIKRGGEIPREKNTAKRKIKSIGKSIIVGLTAPIVFFGTFNFDQVVLPRIGKANNITPPGIEKIEKPKFISLNNSSIQFEKIYVIESKRNASFSFDLTNKDYFTYDANSKISIIGFNEDKELFLVNKKQFDNALKNQSEFVGAFIPNVTLSLLKRQVLGI